MSDQDSPAFVGRRQTDLACHASTKLSFEPQHKNEEAGLVLRGNERNHFDFGVALKDGKRLVFFRKIQDGKVVKPIEYAELGPGDVILSVAAMPLSYDFFYQQGKAQPRKLGTALTRDLSSEKIGGFTGVFIGLYATGNGQKSTSPADFDWFEYRPETE